MSTKKPALLSIISLTTITIVFWIAYEVYLIIITKPNLTVDPKILEPINPTLDLKTLDDLSERIYFEEGEETNAIFSEPEEAPSPTPEEVVPSPEITPSEEVETPTPSPVET